jgi:hypothetical protein
VPLAHSFHHLHASRALRWQRRGLFQRALLLLLSVPHVLAPIAIAFRPLNAARKPQETKSSAGPPHASAAPPCVPPICHGRLSRLPLQSGLHSTQQPLCFRAALQRKPSSGTRALCAHTGRREAPVLASRQARAAAVSSSQKHSARHGALFVLLRSRAHAQGRCSTRCASGLQSWLFAQCCLGPVRAMSTRHLLASFQHEPLHALPAWHDHCCRTEPRARPVCPEATR